MSLWAGSTTIAEGARERGSERAFGLDTVGKGRFTTVHQYSADCVGDRYITLQIWYIETQE